VKAPDSRTASPRLSTIHQRRVPNFPAQVCSSDEGFPFLATNEMFEHVRLGEVDKLDRIVAEVEEFVGRKGPQRSFLYAELMVISAYAATFAGASLEEVSLVVSDFWSAWDHEPAQSRPRTLLWAVRCFCALIPGDIRRDDCAVMAKAKRYLELHYHGRECDLADVAYHVGLNPSYFSHIFKQRTGISFSHYLNMLRLQKAMTLLADPALDVSEVAYSVGYATLHYFTLMFRRFTGLTPTQYRQTLDTRIAQ
jgi:AraC-like DNA-binding protein